jgi:transposase-like protein
VSHANAQLTPRARLRLARLIVEGGWTCATAAKMFMVCPATARKWADRYRSEGVAGMSDRSSRPRRSPTRTSPDVVRQIVRLRWRKRLGPVQIAGQLGVPASTVHAVLTRCRINRLSHIDRVTGEPIRRYEHDHPGSLIHVDVTKFGNIPDGGGWRFVGVVQGDANRRATRERTGIKARKYHPKVGTCFVHTVIDDFSRVAYARTRRPRQPSQSCTARTPGSPNAASMSNACCPTTAPATDPSLGAMPAQDSASHTSGPAPTDRRPTARSSACTAPCPTAGPTPASTAQKPNAEAPSRTGCTSTITTEPTALSEVIHRSAD